MSGFDSLSSGGGDGSGTGAAGGYLSGTYPNPTVAKVRGTATNDAATVGDVGETMFISRANSSATSLTTSTAKDICTTTSITLTPGDWQISGAVAFNPAATTAVTYSEAAVTATSNTLPAAATVCLPTNGEFRNGTSTPAGYVPAGGYTQMIPAFRVSVATATTRTLFLDAYAIFTVSTMTAYGYLEARRMR